MRHWLLSGLAIAVVAVMSNQHESSTYPTETPTEGAMLSSAMAALKGITPAVVDRGECVTKASAMFGVPAPQLKALADRWRTDTQRQSAFSNFNAKITKDLSDAGIGVDQFVRNECVNIYVGALLLSRGYIKPASAP